MTREIIYISIIALCCSCSNQDDYIRDVFVDIEIPINQPEYADLNPIGGSIFINGGVKGIIIYHANINEYIAYDRSCSFEPSNACSTIDSISSTMAFCECCSSVFLIDQDGIAANGPALLPMKKYYTSFSSGKLRITN